MDDTNDFAPSHILVLDDLPDWLRMVGGLLIDYGYEVVTVGSVKEARRSITKNPPFDLAVIDVRLDNSVEMDEPGIDYAYELRKQFANLPIILLTAFQPQVEKVMKITRPPYNFILLEKKDIGQGNPNDLIIQVKQLLPPKDSPDTQPPDSTPPAGQPSAEPAG